MLTSTLFWANFSGIYLFQFIAEELYPIVPLCTVLYAFDLICSIWIKGIEGASSKAFFIVSDSIDKYFFNKEQKLILFRLRCLGLPWLSQHFPSSSITALDVVKTSDFLWEYFLKIL